MTASVLQDNAAIRATYTDGFQRNQWFAIGEVNRATADGSERHIRVVLASMVTLKPKPVTALYYQIPRAAVTRTVYGVRFADLELISMRALSKPEVCPYCLPRQLTTKGTRKGCPMSTVFQAR
jgi:hypothetical protein